LVAEAERLHGIERQLRDVEVDDLPFVEAAILVRTLFVAGLREVARRELALVGDDQAAFAQRIGIHLERRRVHRDQDVGLVAGSFDRGRAEIDLEGGDAEGRALRRADLRREVGEGREVVTGERGRERELAAGQLHAVAAVAGEADDYGFLRRTRRGFLVGDEMGGCGHERRVLHKREFEWTPSLGLSVFVRHRLRRPSTKPGLESVFDPKRTLDCPRKMPFWALSKANFSWPRATQTRPELLLSSTEAVEC